MSIHIEAKQNDIAETILLPGDPLRAKYIAETFLEKTILFNQIRGMLGYTGTYQGKRISVMGTGMGVPSISIYVNELIQSYNVKNLIRVGTMGGLQENIKVRDIVLAQAASTDSRINQNTFKGVDFAPVAHFELLKSAYDVSVKKGVPVKVGNILSADRFYNDQIDQKQLACYGVLGVEMEAAALYTLAQKFGRHALAILTVSDHIFTKEETTAEERETSFNEMIEIALETALK